MSFLSDVLDFELFHGSDLWDRLKDDPKRLLLGVDPWSTKAWNTVLGRDDEPLVDQMGGAYGGSTFSAFGDTDGGVYERAREAGIDTGPGETMQDAAHVVASIYGGSGLAGAFSGGGAAGSSGGGQLSTVLTPNIAEVAPTTVAEGGITSGAGVPSGASAASFDFGAAADAVPASGGGGLLDGGFLENLGSSNFGGGGLLGQGRQQPDLMQRAQAMEQARRSRLQEAQMAQQRMRGLLNG